jgi:hypothetical protein
MSLKRSTLRVATLLGLLALGLHSHPAHASCDDRNVAGLPQVNADHCDSDSIELPHSDYAYVDDPPCPGGYGPVISKFLQSQIASAAGDAASDYGGPFLGWAAQVTTTNVLHSLEDSLGRDTASSNSRCGVLAVRIPPGSTVRKVLGVAQDSSGRTYCGTSDPCGGIGWSRMTNMQQESGQDGITVTAEAKNWSGDRGRHFELLVYYDLPRPAPPVVRQPVPTPARLAASKDAPITEAMLAEYCGNHSYQGGVRNVDQTGYGWKCEPGDGSIDAQELCKTHYGPQAIGKLRHDDPPRTPGEWICRYL